MTSWDEAHMYKHTHVYIKTTVYYVVTIWEEGVDIEQPGNKDLLLGRLGFLYLYRRGTETGRREEQSENHKESHTTEVISLELLN